VLYITTREKNDHFTAYRTLCNEYGPDGGLYIPFQKIKFSSDEIAQLKEKSFGQCTADILNTFFSARLDAWDVDFCIGRYPVKLVPMSHKIIVGETWNNPEWDFRRMVRNLHGRILGASDTNGSPSEWTWIAVRIAVLFGLFSELYRTGVALPENTIDIAVSAGDFSAPIAVWYAREMGLPVGTITFACGDNSSIWDLLNHGELTINNKPATAVGNGVPKSLERLIYACFGSVEAVRFADTLKYGGTYTISEDQVKELRKGIFCAVVSEKRTESVIRSIYRTNTYLLSPESALAYGGLQDYRATNNETGLALILTEKGPLTATEAVAAAIGIAPDDLKARVRAV